jgi:thermostable 8-oxoguanine DNA glycosylase
VKRKARRIEEGIQERQSMHNRGRKEKDRKEVQFCCWLADQFSAALEASQQSVIGCLDTEVRLLCEPKTVVLEV